MDNLRVFLLICFLCVRKVSSRKHMNYRARINQYRVKRFFVTTNYKTLRNGKRDFKMYPQIEQPSEKTMVDESAKVDMPVDEKPVIAETRLLDQKSVNQLPTKVETSLCACDEPWWAFCCLSRLLVPRNCWANAQQKTSW